ncbi:hypothetical protein [Erwinia sp. PsM31]|jgi:hypothetical protein|uniref:hypothetical protein n=1 Tax=Erwinia sp. PsM31 TaxID=3030535 RepID=UPI00263A7A0E|nr:hypothetical protein [Erwinia sp. PsM31]MDN4627793.1 hypothetical protein [Erwinia sp. PsM31]
MKPSNARKLAQAGCASFWLIVGLGCHSARAAMLESQFVDSNGDRICVYNKQFHSVYVNKGFTGMCSFNVPDEELP